MTKTTKVKIHSSDHKDNMTYHRLQTARGGHVRPDHEMMQSINRWYDVQMFTPRPQSKDFANYGYWYLDTRTQGEACENLMEKLLKFIPRKEGKILDVACGKGATTRHLLNYYPAENVSGINISEKQLERCQLNAPGCTFLLMSATDLRFEDNSFDSIICVEAALHFNTRQTFLGEACRVLKPGGYLVLSDVMATKLQEETAPTRTVENYVRNPAHYKSLCLKAGFQTVNVVDATLECWIRFYRHSIRLAKRQLRNRALDSRRIRRRIARLNKKADYIRYYVLVSAQKAA